MRFLMRSLTDRAGVALVSQSHYGSRFVPGLACKTSAGRSAISRQWSSLCSGPVVKYLSGTIGLFPATVFALFRAWRVIFQRDDRPLPGNGLRFVPGLACNTTIGYFQAVVFALLRAWRVIPQRDDRPLPGSTTTWQRSRV